MLRNLIILLITSFLMTSCNDQDKAAAKEDLKIYLDGVSPIYEKAIKVEEEIYGKIKTRADYDEIYIRNRNILKDLESEAIDLTNNIKSIEIRDAHQLFIDYLKATLSLVKRVAEDLDSSEEELKAEVRKNFLAKDKLNEWLADIEEISRIINESN